MPDLGDLLHSVRQQARAGSPKPEPAELQPMPWSWVKAEVSTLRETYDRIGRVNPRPPGWHNALVQLGKRALARGLDWHVRQQRVFNYAAMTSLTVMQSACEVYEKLLSGLRAEMDIIAQDQEEQRTRVALELNRVATAWRQQAGVLQQQIVANAERQKAETAQLGTALTQAEARLASACQSNAAAVRQEMEQNLGALAQDLHALRDELCRMQEQMTTEVRGLRNELKQDLQMLQAGLQSVQDLLAAERAPIEEAFDYFQMEEKLRGDEEGVRQRQAVYVPYFHNRSPVVDLGCGRGEFVRMLLEAGIDARGVDRNSRMVAHAQSRGTPVEQADFFDYLKAQPDASLGGVFSAQVIEHLTPQQLVALLRLAHRKLRPEGVAIFETQNPQCLLSIAGYFWMDPSHRHPIHPRQLLFLAEAAGFAKTDVVWLNECPAESRLPRLPHGRGATTPRKEFDAAIDRFNQYFLGPADYAVVAWKSVPVSAPQS
ncbi:MAG TPA: methyltransferase domain-containing protein [Candidatus Xenobia bacterium]|nr:methyltransferase domain-containing protein [Candidatus Xenobia bacterium]